MNVAQTILEQIGGNQFRVMTGAKNFVGSDNALRFAIPGTSTKNKANRVWITLDATDTYTVTFQRLHAMKLNQISEVSGVYADQLRAVFESATGLRTSLTHVYA